ncbi:hypothetical protein BDV10DRAFT_159145 [Aspergillus recurvatus]
MTHVLRCRLSEEERKETVRIRVGDVTPQHHRMFTPNQSPNPREGKLSRKFTESGPQWRVSHRRQAAFSAVQSTVLRVSLEMLTRRCGDISRSCILLQ